MSSAALIVSLVLGDDADPGLGMAAICPQGA